MSDDVQITRLRRVGGAHYVAVHPKLIKELCWNTRDLVVARTAGTKLVMERVPVEKLGKLKAVALAIRRAKQDGN